jgi:hypothetical protein
MTEFEKVTGLVKNRVVLRCRCRRYRLEGDGRYLERGRFDSDGELTKALRERAAELDQFKADDDARWRAMLEGDDDDPRWTRMWG